MKMLVFLTFIYALDVSAKVHPTFEKALDNESALQQRIVEGILDIQKKNAVNGRNLRGTHSKGICSLGVFEVSSEIPENLKLGKMRK